jgi:hypothetical protein
MSFMSFSSPQEESNIANHFCELIIIIHLYTAIITFFIFGEQNNNSVLEKIQF